MAQLNFGGTVENVVIRDEFPLEKHMTKRLLTDGFRVKLCSVLKKLAKKVRSLCACCLMQQ